MKSQLGLIAIVTIQILVIGTLVWLARVFIFNKKDKLLARCQLTLAALILTGFVWVALLLAPFLFPNHGLSFMPAITTAVPVVLIYTTLAKLREQLKNRARVWPDGRLPHTRTQ